MRRVVGAVKGGPGDDGAGVLTAVTGCGNKPTGVEVYDNDCFHLNACLYVRRY